MTKTEIYIRLDDRDTKIRRPRPQKYLSVLKNVRVSCRVPSSVYVAEGGYIRESGESCEIVPRPMKNRPGREPPPESKRRPSRCFIKPERDFTGNCSP